MLDEEDDDEEEDEEEEEERERALPDVPGVGGTEDRPCACEDAVPPYPYEEDEEGK